MIDEKSKRLIVNINDVRKKNLTRANALLNTTFDEQLAFSRALKEFVSTLQPSYAKLHEDFFVGFEGSFGNRHVTPRTLNARYVYVIYMNFSKCQCSLKIDFITAS